jgi:hypothetical protein
MQKGPELKDELAVYISGMKLIGVLKRCTDPASFANRSHADMLS